MKTDVEILFMADLPSRAVTVYLCMKQYSNKHGQCFPSIKTLAKSSGLSVSTVKRAINDLEKEGFIKKQNRFRSDGGKSSSIYSLINNVSTTKR